MNFALIIDTTHPVPSYYVKNNTAYKFKTNEEYSCPYRTLDSHCFTNTWNYPWLFDGHFINWSEFKYDLPDLDLDLIFLTIERCLNRKEEFPWIDVNNIRKKYPKAKIVGFIKEIWMGAPYDYNDPKHLARLDFLNQCDSIIHNRPELKEFQILQDSLDIPFNFVAQPHNVDYFYNNFGNQEKKDLAIWAFTPHHSPRWGNTFKFCDYLSKKYNIEVRHKGWQPGQDFLKLPLKEFIKQWSSCIFHFNLDPIDYYPGNQCTQVASTGIIHMGGLNDNHHLLYPETATCDEKELEEKFVLYLNDENERNKVIHYAWDKLNEVFSFEAVKKQINNIKYKS